MSVSEMILKNILRGRVAQVTGTPGEINRVQHGVLRLSARRRADLKRIATMKHRGILYIFQP